MIVRLLDCCLWYKVLKTNSNFYKKHLWTGKNDFFPQKTVLTEKMIFQNIIMVIIILLVFIPILQGFKQVKDLDHDPSNFLFVEN